MIVIINYSVCGSTYMYSVCVFTCLSVYLSPPPLRMHGYRNTVYVLLLFLGTQFTELSGSTSTPALTQSVTPTILLPQPGVPQPGIPQPGIPQPGVPKLPAPKPSLPPPPKTYVCPGGSECRHGRCSEDGEHCECQPEWGGKVCEVPCSLDCGIHGDCDVVDDGVEYCRCRLGVNCVDVQADVETRVSEDRTSSRVTPVPLTGCPPGFPCVHGRCPAGQPRCQCFRGWTGSFCTDRCGLSCGVNGECRGVSGRQVCYCLHGYTGSACEEVLKVTQALGSAPNFSSSSSRDTASISSSSPTSVPTSVPTSSPTSVPTRQCLPGFECRHGHCAAGKLECVCDQGWTGFLCQTRCPLDCGLYGRCEVISGILRCVVDHSKLSTSATVPAPRDQVLSTTEVTSDHSSGTLTALSGLTLRSLAERTCIPGSSFICRHGACNRGSSPGGPLTGSVLECVCDSGWIGVFCQDPCPLTCGQHGRCHVFKNGSAYCSCAHQYMGPMCAELRPVPDLVLSPPTWHWWLVGSCLVLVVVLCVLMLVLPYFLWRRHNLFVMKLVHMFQPFEDQDDKLYDAFISYKSTKSDEHFVVNTLYPKLEKSLNFKLCLHFRDFLPGETIANNIIHAVERSRRTILVLSPGYVQSEFCRFEYQRAQHEMLKRKQRLIPIVLHDISGDRMFMDETLKTILDTITYIEWPSGGDDRKLEKFWKMVELSMPKKRTSSPGSINEMASIANLRESAQTVSMEPVPELHYSDWPDLADLDPYGSGKSRDDSAKSRDNNHGDTDHPHIDVHVC